MRGFDLQQNRIGVLSGDRSGERLADDRDGHVDLNLLALLDHEQVDVLDDLVHGVLLDILDQRQLMSALDIEFEHCVGATQEQCDLMAGQGDVYGLFAVAVDDGRDLACCAEATGEALAEAGANLGVDLGVVRGRSLGVFRHVNLLVGTRRGASRRSGVLDSYANAGGVPPGPTSPRRSRMPRAAGRPHNNIPRRG